VGKLFDTLAVRYKDRDGGYTRVLKVAPRHGDSAEMVLLELVDRETPAAS
jgi:large subunit ribosomal protein L17